MLIRLEKVTYSSLRILDTNLQSEKWKKFKIIFYLLQESDNKKKNSCQSFQKWASQLIQSNVRPFNAQRYKGKTHYIMCPTGLYKLSKDHFMLLYRRVRRCHVAYTLSYAVDRCVCLQNHYHTSWWSKPQYLWLVCSVTEMLLMKIHLFYN